MQGRWGVLLIDEYWFWEKDEMAGKLIQSHKDLEVYRLSFAAAMHIFELTKSFPKEERYSLTDQIRRSSRSVSANITEAWRRRRYEGSFLLRLSDAEAEAAETQTWLDYSLACGYLKAETSQELYKEYDLILGKLVRMINNPGPWLIPMRKSGR